MADIKPLKLVGGRITQAGGSDTIPAAMLSSSLAAVAFSGDYDDLINTPSIPSGTVTSVAATVPTGLTVSGSPITTSGTLAIALQSGYSIPTTTKQTEWDTAYTDRNKWDGGATGLTASTGRTSLGGTTVGQNLFTLTNPSAITFPRLNADNTVTALTASNFRTAIGAGTGNGTVTSASVVTANGVSGSVATATTTPAITLTLGAITPSSVAASGTVTGSNLSGTNTGNQTITLTGDVTGSGTGSFAATIANDAVTYAKMQNVSAASRLLGRGSASGAGNPEELTVGTGLSISGTVLAATNNGTVTSVSGTGSVNGITLTGTVTSSGNITLGGALTNVSLASQVTGTLPVTGGGSGRATSTTAYGLLAAGTTATGAHQTLAAGLTTQLLVGGGASALPAWTTATGSGAPVRAATPSFTTTIGVGGATASASGSGVSFPATVSDSTDPNTLDDYEEGSWTPTDGSGAGLSLTVSGAVYQKIGNTFSVFSRVQYPATANGAAAVIGGLPFTTFNANGASTGIFGYTNAANAGFLIVPFNSAILTIYTPSGAAQTTNAQMSSSVSFFSGFSKVA